MKIDLEQVDAKIAPYRFRVGFHSSEGRCLLQYPNPTDFEFVNIDGPPNPIFGIRILGSFPIDDFVLNPNQRITFDVDINVNGIRDGESVWRVDLEPGNYCLTFVYEMAEETEWYDFLAKRSRFAALTPIWRGTVRSNKIELVVCTNSGQAK